MNKVFLTVPARYLTYTEFDKHGYRAISSRTKNIHKYLGTVKDGEWDLNRTPIDDWIIYKSLKSYFFDGIDLKDTPYYSEKLDEGRKNGIWYQITSKNYEKEVQRITHLFKSLKANGYKSQRDLGNPNPLDEIRVKIARDGTFLWENSIHRFVIAKLLKLEKITVVVTVRHHDWINLKKKLIELAQKRDGSQINEERNLRYYHPDLEEIPYCREGEKVIEKHLETQKSITTKTEVVV